MKIAIESTSKIVTLDGVPARVWEGETESGIPVHCFITRIAVADVGANTEQFEAELTATAEPSVNVLAIPAHLIL